MNIDTHSHEVALLRRAFACAVEASQPARCLTPALAQVADPGPAVVLGAGKAAASMAAAFYAHWAHPVRGLVVTRYEHGLRDGEDAGEIEVIEAGHAHSPNTLRAASSESMKASTSSRSL